ncbi:MAG TPA: FAD-binding oxidoreductase [Steroidobacteraceae bacterium]|nr:FAD-binding oxidoreductase [Steroidobacteraceae bacterium]
MAEQETIAVIGAGVIGSAIACALAQEGRDVLLLDRAPPGEAGASFGNAGHIAAELVEPLPSPGLLFGFWRELFAFGGVLDVPARRLGAFLPWAARFGQAAFRRERNTAHLAPFVRPSVTALIGMLRDIGRPDLIRQHGHYELWLDGDAERGARTQALAMERLGVPTQPAPRELVESARQAARAATAAALHFPLSAHVLDPLEVVRAFAADATQRGARFLRREVRDLRASGAGVQVITATETILARSAIVCLGAWSAPLLAPFGLKVPLEAARGYHVQMPGAIALVDAPLLYADAKILVTPMAGRVRATSFMEFAGADAPPDPRKPACLRDRLRTLGYHCDEAAPGWVGPRPVLPDYLPAMGRVAAAPNVLYAFGHQHIGLTLCAVTARAMADLVAGRTPAVDVSAFDLRRFGAGKIRS